MPWIEKEGRTVEEAQTAALAELGLPVEETEIEVLREGAKGLFGLGGEAALVRVRARAEAPDVRAAFHDRPLPVELAKTAVATVTVTEVATGVIEPPSPDGDGDGDGEGSFEASGMSLAERQEITTQVAVEMVTGIIDRMGLQGEVTTRVAGGTVYVEVFGDDMGILIGRGGKTLEALQEIVRAGVQRRLKARGALVVDVEAYWERRRDTGRRPSGNRRDSGRSNQR